LGEQKYRSSVPWAAGLLHLLESWKIARNRTVSLSRHELTTVSDIAVIALPSNDLFAKIPRAYMFEKGGIRVFHSGDSFFFDKLLGYAGSVRWMWRFRLWGTSQN